ncbi:MAG: haloacid dehalogenase-like hydrolase [Oscillospiraceae bacterium]|nr:haloacid dehalogenase-like hydrolase [Oscillospiraceae bacterium]
MNVYDFDKTIFYPDSSYTFFLYCLKKHPGAVLRFSPGILAASLRYAFGRIGAKALKEKLFAYLRCLSDPEKLVEEFWDEHFALIGEWYLRQRKPDDLIITASPEFLVGEAGRRLGAEVIGTRMDIRSGRIEGENCHDAEKVLRFRALYPEETIEAFYSDSLSDTPLAEIAERAFLVDRGRLSDWR